MKMCPAGSSIGAAAPFSESNGKPASSSGPVKSPSIGAAAPFSESNGKPASSSGLFKGDQAFSCEQYRLFLAADPKRLVYHAAFQGTACSN